MNEIDIKDQAVIMCGISGSGKTHFALKLEKEGFHRLSIDALIWNKIGESLNNLTKEEKRKIFKECREEINRKLITLLKAGKKIVVDGTNCQRSGRDEIRNLCKGIGISPIFVYCHADKEKLWNRLCQRRGIGPDDLIVTKEELDSYWHGFEGPQENESDFIIL